MNQDSKLCNYLFDLPDSAIAQRPLANRQDSKLLVYDQARDQITHSTFSKLPTFIDCDTTLVFNQSKVYPCRLEARKKSGGKAELFMLSTELEQGGYQALVKTSSKKRLGDRFLIGDDCSAEIIGLNSKGSFQLAFDRPLAEILEQYGKVPIPPYIRNGQSDLRDRQDYQTVYASQLGSVAAPTAGLHFTPELMQEITAKAYVNLHVGLGTFAPVKEQEIEKHQMHSERFSVSKANLEVLKKASKKIAVGTTSLRVLESLERELVGDFVPDKSFETDIFIYPGQEVNSIDGLITNFHLPGSSLLMLVSALIGRQKLLELYRQAIAKDYRFFSYGDAMLILRGERS
ncbi:MAG: tRNA preQ1(34) S-adenosylmethionine ribosyltransferase-isomerase QueA [Halobacteriovoraceae bacterium]|jgi:S-adenosylmethionine:tRNA ribosyltransferase-isomerase|nr:tRNA preQ1(34) S-adenosylmethionine ribosyltransferase-isomerase QueA [Halobacteriovoraceae bacterium]MBT5094290.1 tRNA preQ1(34) S-adenosylmethionine ribosyltransferase-isomerase QueA [Halobacteriovoraceae bacterium]